MSPTIDPLLYQPADGAHSPKYQPLVLRLMKWLTWAFLGPLVPFLGLFALMVSADSLLPAWRNLGDWLWPVAVYLTLVGLAYAGVLLWYAAMPYGKPRSRLAALVGGASILALGAPLVVVALMNIL